MFKLPYERIREEDYWLYPIVLINIVCIAIATYASVLVYRAPAIIIGFLGIWFTSTKFRDGYSRKRARVHVGLTLLVGLALAIVVYVLTN